ncbi:MAG: hypothetical protein SGI88_20685 [Candidatus Hydrogenedentes bacterium]|nr:hypothetical protein [Candidatus Hydrogenedentota bacterium]
MEVMGYRVSCDIRRTVGVDWIVAMNSMRSTRSVCRLIVFGVLTSALVVGCQPESVIYQIVEFVGLSESLKGNQVKVEIFRRPKFESDTDTESQNALLAKLGHPELVQAVATLKTARVTAKGLTIEHLHSYSSSWSWCHSTWAIVNDSEHELKIDTAKCVWVSSDKSQPPRKPYYAVLELNGEMQKVDITDSTPLLPNEQQPVPPAGATWPVLTIPPHSIASITFGYATWFSKKAKMELYLENANTNEVFHYQFRLTK